MCLEIGVWIIVRSAACLGEVRWWLCGDVMPCPKTVQWEAIIPRDIVLRHKAWTDGTFRPLIYSPMSQPQRSQETLSLSVAAGNEHCDPKNSCQAF